MRIFLACHSYFGKCKVRYPLLIPLLGLMLSMWRSAEDDHFYEFTRKYGNPAENPTCTRGIMHPPFLLHRGVPMFPFPPSLSVYRGGRRTCLGAPRALQRVCSNSWMVHTGRGCIKWSRMQPRLLLQVPTGRLCQGCALLLGWCCASFILTVTNFLGYV